MKTICVLKRMIRIFGWTVGGVLLFVALLLGYLWIQSNRKVFLPAPMGSYAVGRTEYDWVDETRSESLSKELDAKRELAVWIWHPVTATQTPRPVVEYLPGNWRKAREQGQGIAARFLMQNLGSVGVHVIADAPVAPTHPSYPVLIFEPGLGPIATDYTTLAEDLASHGYIVVACTPTYSASVVVFPDGRIAYGTKEGSVPDAASVEASNEILNRLINVWAADDLFVLNQLEKLNQTDPSGKFTGRLDLKSVGVFGHSFGGCAAAQACRLDSRFRAGVDIDGYPRGDVIQAGISQPFMFIWSVHTENPEKPDAELRQATRNIQAIYGKLNHGGYQITVNGARHFNFTDNGVFYSPFLKMEQALGPINGRRALMISTDYLSAFFDRYLKGDDEPLLKGPSLKYPEAQFESVIRVNSLLGTQFINRKRGQFVFC
jgi:dienelactone hydrolase